MLSGDLKNKFLCMRTSIIYQMFWRCVATYGCSVYIAEGCPSKIIWNIYFKIVEHLPNLWCYLQRVQKSPNGSKRGRIIVLKYILSLKIGKQYMQTWWFICSEFENDFIFDSDVTFNRYFPLRKMGSNMDKNHSWQGNLMFPFFWGLMVSLRTVFTIIIFLFFDFLFSQTNTFSHDCASLKAKPVYNQSANIWH